MKTKLTLLIALCLTMAPLTWADEINVELDIIDDLKDVEAWEFRVLELEGLDRERADEPTDELAEHDEPGFDETDDIPERDHLIAEVGSLNSSESADMDPNDSLEPVHEFDEEMDDADEMDESNVDDLKDESDIADHMDEPMDEPMEEIVDEPMDEPMDEVVEEPMEEPMDEVVEMEGTDGTDANPVG